MNRPTIASPPGGDGAGDGADPLPPTRALVVRHKGATSRTKHFATLAAFAILYMSAIGFNSMTGMKKDLTTGDGDMLRQVVYAALFAIVLLVSVVTERNWRNIVALPVAMILALIWCWLSVSWAIEPDVSFRRVLLTTMIAWLIFRLVNLAGYDALTSVARQILMLTLVLNYAFVMFTSQGVHHAQDVVDTNLVGAWKGITAQKNFAGAVCAFTLLLFIFDASKINPVIRYLIVASSAYFLYKTLSKTSMGLVIISIFTGVLYLRYNPAYRILLVPFSMIACGALLIFLRSHWYYFANPFFDKSDFTNRGEIWMALIDYSKDHWLLGAGFGSFWNIGGTTPIYEYSSSWVRRLGNGHDGYLDLLVSIGAPGLILVVMAMIVMPVFRMLLSVNITRHQGALLTSFIVFCTFHNLTETSLFDRDSVVNVFMMLAVALSYRATAALRTGKTPSRNFAHNSLRPFKPTIPRRSPMQHGGPS